MYLEPKEKVILASFLSLILASQTHELRKKSQKKPENESNSQRRVISDSFFSSTSIPIPIIIPINIDIVIKTLF